MAPIVYETAKWFGTDGNRFICSHAVNRRLCTEEHSHEFFEIIWLFAGTAEHQVNGVIRHMESNDVIWLRPGDAHVWLEQSEEIELFNISAVPDEIFSFLRTYDMESALYSVEEPVLFRNTPSHTRSLFKLFQQLSAVPTLRERDSILRIIIGETLQNYMLLSLEKERDWFQNILFRMKEPENLAEGVPAMMRLANLSHAQLCRVLKKMSLDPPNVCIRELRLSTARELVQNTSMSLEDISQHIGYASVSHFSTAFKARYGVAPGTMRRNASSFLT